MCEESCEESERKLQEIRKPDCLFDEMKWTKAPTKPGNYFEGYKAVLKFYSETPWEFTALVIDTHKYPLKHAIYTNNSTEIGYYKYFYQLLRAGMKRNKESNYDICLDPKLKEIAGSVETLQHCLNGGAVNDNFPESRGFQVCTVKEFKEPDGGKRGSACLELTDLLTGMVAARWNQKVTNKLKLNLIEFTERLLKVDMSLESKPDENKKMNIWKFEPNERVE